MINDVFEYMAICLMLTILIEVVVSLLLKVKKLKDILNIILVNVLTNPLVVSITFMLNAFYGVKYYYISLIILEILAVTIEGIIYKKYLDYKIINPFILSIILNLVSYLFGYIIF